MEDANKPLLFGPAWFIIDLEIFETILSSSI